MTERMNMLRVAAPEKSGLPSLSFNPERQIAQAGWSDIETKVEAEKRAKRPKNYLGVGSKLKILHPSSDIELDNNAYQLLLLHDLWRNNLDNFVIVAAQIKMVDPSYPLPLGREHKDKLQEIWKSHPDNPYLLANLKLIMPELTVTVEQFETVLKQLKEKKNLPLYYKALASWRIASCRAIPLDREDWKRMREAVESDRKFALGGFENLNAYLDIASSVKILAAKNVEVTQEKGLRVDMEPEAEENKRELPEPLSL